ncbi:MAG TPA: hypothetical protein VFV94_09710 [Polyangiaceae bacterium]|nr:hypothetical protein [Polyangiaceae bacterium]
MTFVPLAGFVLATFESAAGLAAEPDARDRARAAYAYGDGAPPNSRARAADAYDAGVDAYGIGKYALAARHFLDADTLVPSEDALYNAFMAAKASRDPALVEETAQRVVDRKGVSPSLRGAALVALARPEPSIAAAAPAPAPEATPVRDSAVALHAQQSKPAEDTADEGGPAWARPVFYTGVGVTAVLAGLTTLSGLDTLQAKNQLPGTQADNDSVMHRAYRTDALLVGTLVAAGATAYVGLSLVDWGPAKVQVAASVAPDRATLSLEQRF